MESPSGPSRSEQAKSPERPFPNPVFLKSVRMVRVGSSPTSEPAVSSGLMPDKTRHLGQAAEGLSGYEYQAVDEKRFSFPKEAFEKEGQARGGFAVVVRGYDEGLGKAVAIKLLRPDLADKFLIGESDAARLFYDEVKAVANLEHHNIAKVYDVVEAEIEGKSTIGMALEWLRPIVYKGMDLEEAARMASQIGSALDFVHSRGMTHKDIKPGNIMRRDDGDYVLTDFGSTRTLGLQDDSEMVTPEFIDPEYRAGKKSQMMERMDQYALALSICELIGEESIVTTKDPNLYLLPSTVPRPVRDVLVRALDPLREERYPSCSAFAQDFEKAIRDSAGSPEAAPANITGITLQEVDALEEGPLKAIYQEMIGDILNPRYSSGTVSHRQPTLRPAITDDTPSEMREWLEGWSTSDPRILVDKTQIPLLKPIIMDVPELLGLDQDQDLSRSDRLRLQKYFGPVKIAYQAHLQPQIEPSGQRSATEIVYAGVTKKVFGGDNVKDLTYQFTGWMAGLIQKKTEKPGLWRILGKRASSEAVIREEWRNLGDELVEREATERAEFLIEQLKSSELEQAKAAYSQGDYTQAKDLLLDFIGTNPELGLEVRVVKDGVVNDVLNDYSDDTRFNNGVVRVPSQFPAILARAICYESVSATRTVYNLFKDIVRNRKLAFLIIDDLQDSGMYKELSHELNAWLVSGFWYSNKGGDWRGYIDQYFSEENGHQGVNRILDKHYVPE